MENTSVLKEDTELELAYGNSLEDIEENETGEDACMREMIEELNATVSVDKYLGTVEHDYEDFHLSMDAYLCTLISDYNLNEALDSKWVSLEDLDSLPWCDADKKVVQLIKENE